IALFYGLNAAALLWALHRMAACLEARWRDPLGPPSPDARRRWWALRVLPALICIVQIGLSLSRGQVTTVILLCVCMMGASLLERRNFGAGLWLAGAICLKVSPAYLLLEPLMRRDWRCLAGCGFGLLIGLVLVPAAALGPQRALAEYGAF